MNNYLNFRFQVELAESIRDDLYVIWGGRNGGNIHTKIKDDQLRSLFLWIDASCWNSNLLHYAADANAVPFLEKAFEDKQEQVMFKFNLWCSKTL